jgi:hypothetical protein
MLSRYEQASMIVALCFETVSQFVHEHEVCLPNGSAIVMVQVTDLLAPLHVW